MEGDFQITSKLKRPIPKAPYEAIKNEVLGKKYSLSLVFVGNTISKKLNAIYRNKDKPTNVLSFPIDKTSGEIFIDLKKVESELKIFQTNLEDHVTHLFIHGLLHLKGLEHGSTMEEQEKKLCKKFKA